MAASAAFWDVTAGQMAMVSCTWGFVGGAGWQVGALLCSFVPSFLRSNSETWGQGGWAKASEQGEWRENMGGCYSLVSKSLSPFIISSLGCSWLPLPTLGCCLPPCLPSLCPFMISGLGCFVSQACLASWCPFWAAPGCRCRLVSQARLSSWSPFWAALGCRCCVVFQACLPSWFLFWAALGCRCRLEVCLPSWFPFWAALGCRCCLVSQLVSLHDFPSGLLLALPPKLVSLHDFPSGLLLAAAAPPKLVSLHDFPPGLLLVAAPANMISPGAALGCRCRLSLPSWIPFWAALLLVPVASCFCFCGVVGSQLFVVCCLFLSWFSWCCGCGVVDVLFVVVIVSLFLWAG